MKAARISALAIVVFSTCAMAEDKWVNRNAVCANAGYLTFRGDDGVINMRSRPDINAPVLWKVDNFNRRDGTPATFLFCGKKKRENDSDRTWLFVSLTFENEPWPHAGWVSDKLVSGIVEDPHNAPGKGE